MADNDIFKVLGRGQPAVKVGDIVDHVVAEAQGQLKDRELSGTITAYFDDPAMYKAYKQGQEELASFLLDLLAEADVKRRDDYDLHRPFIDRNCFGIPVRKWIDILAAIKADIANAKATCGSDGLGCAGFRGYYGDNHERRYRKCGQCPMEALSNVRGAIADV